MDDPVVVKANIFTSMRGGNVLAPDNPWEEGAVAGVRDHEQRFVMVRVGSDATGRHLAKFPPSLQMRTIRRIHPVDHIADLGASDRLATTGVAPQQRVNHFGDDSPRQRVTRNID